MHEDIFQDPLMTATGHHPGEIVLSISRDTGHPELGVRVEHGITSFFFYQAGKIGTTVLPTREVRRLLKGCGPFDVFFVVAPTQEDNAANVLDRRHYLSAIALSRLREFTSPLPPRS